MKSPEALYPRCASLGLQMRRDGIDQMWIVTVSDLRRRFPQRVYGRWREYGYIPKDDKVYVIAVEDFLRRIEEKAA